MFLPIAHNGQTFDLAPQDSHHTEYRVMLSRDTFAPDADVEEGCPEDINEHIGTIRIDHFYGRISAWTRYGYAGPSFYTLNDAVGHIADTYRQCSHGDATQRDGDIWNCDICGDDFTRED